MDFSGKYNCLLKYGIGYELQAGKELTFSMEIIEEDNYFNGTALDIEGVGVNPDEAKVSGIINGIYIEFYKIYKRGHYSDEAGNIVFEDQEGIPILYKGDYNEETGFYEGTWEFIAFIKKWFFFKKQVDIGSGTFQLRKSVD